MLQARNLSASGRNLPNNRHHPVIVAIAVTLMGVATVGCLSMFPPLVAETDGTGTMTVSVLGGLPMVTPGATLRVTLERGHIQLHQQVPFTDATENITIKNISAGPWDVTAELLDKTGLPTYEGSTSAHVQAGAEAHIRISLSPLNGQLSIKISLGDDCIHVSGESGCLAELTKVGRLNINPNVKIPLDGDFTWTPGDTEATLRTASLLPGSYDFQIVFWREARTPTNILFEGFWTPFDILPGRTTSIVWHPEIGLLDVGIDVEGPPAPPGSLTATVSGVEVILMWEPPADFVSGYNVYGRQNDREAFRALLSEPILTPSWKHTLDASCDDESAQPFFYVVTAVNGKGYESLRSNEVSVCR